MDGGAVLITLCINCLVIYFLHIIHKRSISNTIQNLRKEVNELENLVAAIIEEFEEVADRVWQTDAEKEREEPVKKKNEKNYEKSIEFINPIESPTFKADKFEETVSIELDNSIPEKKQEGPLETIPMFQPQEIIDPKHHRILQLWKDGLAVEEIAKQLGTGRGEIQLILGIYRRS